MNTKVYQILLIFAISAGLVWFVIIGSQQHNEISNQQYTEIYRIYQTSESTRPEIDQILKTGGIDQIQYSQINNDSDIGSIGRLTLKKIANQQRINGNVKDNP